jgi:transcriptional regulator with XRE-family HTH domain
VESEKNLVKKTCRELGITQKELAERIGVSRQTVSDWSSGRTNISQVIQETLRLLVVEQEYKNFQYMVKKAIESR